MKKIAFFLAVILAVGIVPYPPVKAYAAPGNMQMNVSDLIIRNDATDDDPSSYTVSLDWRQPQRGDTDDSSVGGPDNALGYRVYYRNATTRDPEEEIAIIPDGADDAEEDPAQWGTVDSPGTPYSILFPSLPMESNSFYEFYVDPIHRNYRITQDVDGDDVNFYYDAPIDSRSKPEQRGLYLTNLTVTAEGNGNELTVRWARPTLDGTDVFTEYGIYYQQEDGRDTLIEASPTMVDIEDPAVTAGSDIDYDYFEYTITDDGLLPGVFYEIKVEPFDNGMPVRMANQDDITVGGTTYSLAYKPYDEVEYRNVNNVFIRPGLEATYEGYEFVKLIWGDLASLITNNLEQIQVFRAETAEDLAYNSQTGEVAAGEEIMSILSGQFTDETFTNLQDRLYRHDGKTWYFIVKYTFAENKNNPTDNDYVDFGRFIFTEVAVFIPSESDYDAYNPDIKVLEDPDTSDNNFELDVRWLAFMRRAYNEQEESAIDETEEEIYGLPGFFVDQNIEYDIYVADSLEYFDAKAFPSFRNNDPITTFTNTSAYEPFPSLEGDADPTEQRVPTYMTTVSEYYTGDGSGGFTRQPLLDNSVYYVLVVSRLISNDREAEATSSVYIPPAGTISTEPQIMDAPPLTVTDTTTDSITIQWPTKFIEMYNASDRRWYPAAALKDGKLVFGSAAQAIEKQGLDGYYILNELMGDGNYPTLMTDEELTNPADVREYLDDVNGEIRGTFGSGAFTSPGALTTRVVNLGSDTDYEVHVVTFDEMMAAGGYDAYRARISDWQAITPVELDPKDPSVDGRDREYVVTGLDPNTAYVIYVRPFDSESDKRAYLPNYVTGITEDEKGVVPVDPNTPVLFPDESKTTHNSLTVYWENMGIETNLNPSFQYDLYYAETLEDYDSRTGTPLLWDTIKADIVKGRGKGSQANDGKEYLYYSIPGLFPDTLYYIWAVARVVYQDGTQSTPSVPSNPVDMRTDDIEAPSPPILGSASNYLIDRYNRANGTTYAQTEPNALNVTTSRNSNDEGPPATSGTSSVAGNIQGTASLLPLDIAETFYMTRFEGLTANREYYVRAKTVFTVKRSGTAVTEDYSYVIQVSLDEDYTSYIQFAIPSYTPESELDDLNNKQKESEWAEIDLETDMSDDQFGGNIDPEMYPLPEQDWEITYDEDLQKLKFRFRSNLTDADGNEDQYADQRFISRLVTDRTFNYTVDLSTYQNEPIVTREVELPFTIMQAFDERQITMEVKTGDFDLSIPPGSFDTSQVRSLQMGAGSNLIMTLSSEPTGLPSLNDNEQFSVQPQKFAAKVTTESRTVNVESFASPINVSLSANGHTAPDGVNAGLYYASPNTGDWQNISGQYSYGSNALSGSITRAGSFAAVSKLSPDPVMPASRDASFDAMQRVTQRLNITDMSQYNAAENVTAARFNNLVAAVALEKQTVSLGGSMTPADQQSLSKAGLLTGGTLTREAAMSTMVKLYELKSREILKPMTTMETLPGIERVSAPYRESLLKAADLGFINGELDPAHPLTMGDFMVMLDIVLQDAR